MKWLAGSAIALLVIICGCGGGGSSSGGLTTGGTASTSGSTTGSTTGSTSSTSGATGTTSGTSTSTSGGGGSQASFTATISSNSPVFDDGGHYETLSLQGIGSGNAVVTASSSDLDPMCVVEVFASDGTASTLAEDDDSGGGTSSKVSFPVSAGTSYSVIVTSPTGDPAGQVKITYPSDLLKENMLSPQASAPANGKAAGR